MYAISNELRLQLKIIKIKNSTNFQKSTNKKPFIFNIVVFNKIKFVHWQRLYACCYV